MAHALQVPADTPTFFCKQKREWLPSDHTQCVKSFHNCSFSATQLETVEAEGKQKVILS